MEYYSAMKMDKLELHALKWIGLKMNIGSNK